MNILHYGLGFPPYRTGGLTKFCVDLMLTQKEQGDRVGLLWPGEINPFRKNTICKRKEYKGIESFEIINPLPVALDEGISNVEPYMQSANIDMYMKFVQKFKPDIVHIHTLMGIHKELIDVCKKLNIKTVFTTHDYYGICPKVTLYQSGVCCPDSGDCSGCVVCNLSGLSQKKIMILQSPLYRLIKDSTIIKALRKKHRQAYFQETMEEKREEDRLEINEQKKADYQRLRRFYLSILNDIDLIHFNSSVTEKIYLRYIQPKNKVVIPITHRNIEDNRTIKNYDSDKLNITYLAPAKPFKGYQILKEALDDLWNKGERNFELQLFNLVPNPSPYMLTRDGYQYSELKDILNQTDVIIAPSVWYETFGFTVLEALSFGVPVIISNRVGAKDLIGDSYGIVCEPTKESIIETILTISDKSRLSELNEKICIDFQIPKMQILSKDIYESIVD